MKKIYILRLFLFLVLFDVLAPLIMAQAQSKLPVMKVSMQKRLPSELEKGAFYITSEIQEWNPSETAIIICDMWDQHWCKGAAARVAEMAPSMNNVVSIARDRGVFIVHA